MNKIIFVIIILSLATMTGCTENEITKEVDFSKKEVLTKEPDIQLEGSIKIAVGGMITPREGFAYYKRFLDYIEKKTGRPVEFVDREDYAEINNLVKKGDVDAAFVCGGPYVDGHKEFGMELLAAPVSYGDSVYYSYIIVHKDSPITDLEGLRGKTFAFTDPLSNTGKLVPTYMLAMMNETPESFFSKFIFARTHDKSIRAVAMSIVDGAAVDSLIWEYAQRINPEFSSQTKIIKKSPPYGIPPVVVKAGLDSELKNKLKEIFLNAHKDPEGIEILKGMMIDRFVEINDSAYDSIREMKEWLEKNK